MEAFKYTQEDSVLIRHEYEEINSNLIQIVTRKMDTKKNFLMRIIKCNYDKQKYKYHNIKEGDVCFFSRYVDTLKKFQLDNDSSKYSNAPMMQILGVFREERMVLDSLEILDGNVLVEPIEEVKEGGIILAQKEKAKCNIGRVVKHGKGGFFNKNWERRENPLVREGDIILYWDNVATNIMFSGRTYLCIGDYSIIGTFTDGKVSVENLNMLDGRILLEEEREIKIGSIIIPKDTTEQYEEYSRPENRFRVIKISDTGKEIKNNVFLSNENIVEDSTVVIDPAITRNVSFLDKDYVTVESIEDIHAVL